MEAVCSTLEAERREMQDVEFTIEDRKLYMLQTRDGKRSGPAAVRIAAEMVDEGLIDRREALLRSIADHVAQMLAPEFDPARRSGRSTAAAAGQGPGGGPGAASGSIA